MIRIIAEEPPKCKNDAQDTHDRNGKNHLDTHDKGSLDRVNII